MKEKKNFATLSCHYISKNHIVSCEEKELLIYDVYSNEIVKKTKFEHKIQHFEILQNNLVYILFENSENSSNFIVINLSQENDNKCVILSRKIENVDHYVTFSCHKAHPNLVFLLSHKNGQLRLFNLHTNSNVCVYPNTSILKLSPHHPEFVATDENKRIIKFYSF